ncbi:MAG: hypothetical protein IJ698_00225 [Prevotella sp.]|nr:hypothetical protein [Prevotella sp.]
MTYIFSSERQLIFKVVVGGRDRLVEFGERNGSGRSLFVTENSYIAGAIRRHDFYKNGIIEEAAMESPRTREGDKEGAGESEAGEISQDVKDSNVQEFENISAAREYLVRTFGVDRKSVKLPSQIKSQAKKCGVEIRF